MARVTPAAATRADAVTAMAAEGCGAPRAWANGPGDTYGAHDHERAKVLYCVEGSIVFHVAGEDLALGRGDRLDLPARTVHAATVGPSGCACVEAWAP
ncbi:MAG TPA: cupin domain-containing protein [Actinomycetota bacterium]|nr:cupin domain-containing protein [Actinomycetota bacterium]